MTIPELRELYQTQQLVEAIIEPSFQEGEWIVEFRHQMGDLCCSPMKMVKSAVISISIALRNPPWRLGFVKFELKTSSEMVKSKSYKTFTSILSCY